MGLRTPRSPELQREQHFSSRASDLASSVSRELWGQLDSDCLKGPSPRGLPAGKLIPARIPADGGSKGESKAISRIKHCPSNNKHCPHKYCQVGIAGFYYKELPKRPTRAESALETFTMSKSI